MNKHAIAMILEEIGTLLEVHGENKFKARAFLTAARAIEQVEADVRTLARGEELQEVPGIGPVTATVIRELLTTGTSQYYLDLRARTPDGLLELLAVPRLGAGKVRTLSERLGIASLDELELAAREGRVAPLPGFGERTQQRILDGIAYVRTTIGRRRMAETVELGRRLRNFVRAQDHVHTAELAGELRRACETVAAVEVVAAVEAGHMHAIIDTFLALPGVAGAARMANGANATLSDGLGLRLRCAPPAEYATVLVFETGSAAHVDALQKRAKERGLDLTSDGLRRSGTRIELESEDALYRWLDLPVIPPEVRESGQEVESAARGELPALVEDDDLRGVFHCHTTFSDGTASVAEMAEGARVRGWRYLGIADHSQHASYAGGLTLDELRQQHDEIDAWNEQHGKKVWVFKGVEADILTDGTVDYEKDDVLHRFDFVIGSVHSSFNLSAEAMTDRFLRALENPYLTMLGHLTGRLLLSRKGYTLDIPRVLAAAAQRGVAVEINADPRRLDLGWEHWPETRGLGLHTAINPDAHSVRGLDVVEYGVSMARKGWLGADRVINCWTLTQVKAFLRKARRT